MIKAYKYLYYRVYLFAQKISDDPLNDWKPAITLIVLQCLVLIQIFVWIIVVTKTALKIKNPTLFFFLIALFLAITNYYLIMRYCNIREMELEFKEQRKKNKIRDGYIIIIAILAVLTSLIVAFYKLSTIKWY